MEPSGYQDAQGFPLLRWFTTLALWVTDPFRGLADGPVGIAPDQPSTGRNRCGWFAVRVLVKATRVIASFLTTVRKSTERVPDGQLPG